MGHSPSCRLGRPRDEEIGGILLESARKLTLKYGYDKVTTQQIALSSGASKQTIYRRWPGKAELILDAFLEDARKRVDRVVEKDSRGPLRSELKHFLMRTFWALEGSGIGVKGLMAEAQRDEAFCRLFKERFVEPRRASLEALFQRARVRREISDTPFVPVIIQTIYGALWYRLLLNEPLSEEFADSLVEVALRACHRGTLNTVVTAH